MVLVRDVIEEKNNWDNPYAENLLLEWAPLNLTSNINTRVMIDLMGFWEDEEQSRFEQIGTITENAPNNGRYTFDPRTLNRQFEESNSKFYIKLNLYLIIL